MTDARRAELLAASALGRTVIGSPPAAFGVGDWVEYIIKRGHRAGTAIEKNEATGSRPEITDSRGFLQRNLDYIRDRIAGDAHPGRDWAGEAMREEEYERQAAVRRANEAREIDERIAAETAQWESERALRPVQKDFEVKTTVRSEEGEDTPALIKSIVGRNVPDSELERLGGLEGSQVDVITVSRSHDGFKGFRVMSRHESCTTEMTLSKKGEDIVAHYDFIKAKENKRNSLLVPKALGRQFRAMQKLGVTKISTNAARDSDLIGYKVWPKLGFDGPIPEKTSQKLPEEFRDAKTIQELYARPGGRAAWEKDGESIGLTLDMSRADRAIKIFERMSNHNHAAAFCEFLFGESESSSWWSGRVYFDATPRTRAYVRDHLENRVGMTPDVVWVVLESAPVVRKRK